MTVATLKRTNTTSDSEIRANAGGLNESGFTMAGWFVVGASAGAFNTYMFLQGVGGQTLAWMGIQSNMYLSGYHGYDNNFSVSLGPVSIGDMLYLAISSNGSSTSFYCSKAGAAFTKIEKTYQAVAGQAPAWFKLLASGTIDPSNASVDHIRTWNDALTESELALERDSVTPVRTNSIWSAATLADTSSGLLDTTGNSRNWSASVSVSNLTAGTPNTYLPKTITTLITGVNTLKRSDTLSVADIRLAVTGVSQTSYTACAWFVVGPIVGAYNSLFMVRDSNDGLTYSWMGLQSDSGLYGFDEFSNTFTPKLMDVVQGDQIFLAMVINGTTATYYASKNGAAFVSQSRTFNNSVVAVPGILKMLSHGSIDPSSASTDHGRFWNSSLTAAELLLERDNVAPVRTAGIWSAATLADTTTGLLDTTGNNRNWTIQASVIVAGTKNTYLPKGVPRRAMTLVNGIPSLIPDAQVGTGVKPLVLVNAILQTQVATEGVSVTFDTDKSRGIINGEYLEV